MDSKSISLLTHTYFFMLDKDEGEVFWDNLRKGVKLEPNSDEESADSCDGNDK